MIIHLSRRLEMETLEMRYKHQQQQRALVRPGLAAWHAGRLELEAQLLPRDAVQEAE